MSSWRKTRADENIKIKREDWSGAEWDDIKYGGDWLRAYLPYNDEPLRSRGQPLEHPALLDYGSHSPRLLQAALGIEPEPWHKDI